MGARGMGVDGSYGFDLNPAFDPPPVPAVLSVVVSL